jgi:peptidoglycan/LPS O-acetylase OafA/YrhL
MKNINKVEAKLTHPKYRPDIDGLRAIAVLAVVGFHAFGVQGGFAGVDIFFVISGYLISTIIFEDLQKNTFSFFKFYIRRIKRILPALTLVMFAVLIAGYFLLVNDEFAEVGKHLAAGSAFGSNLVLWLENGYFNTDAELKPLLHLWSLGVEEQFYLFWPLLVFLFWSARFGPVKILIIIFVVSFGINLYQVGHDSIGAFYSPITRFWELLIGSMLAYLHVSNPKTLANLRAPSFKNLLSVLGVCLIILCFLF